MPDPTLRERVRAALIAAPPGREVDAVMELLEAPAPAGPFRTGRKLGRTVYNGDDILIGVMDTPELGAMVVDALNGAIGAEAPGRGCVGCGDPGCTDMACGYEEATDAG